jgi:hypothetical protein
LDYLHHSLFFEEEPKTFLFRIEKAAFRNFRERTVFYVLPPYFPYSSAVSLNVWFGTRFTSDCSPSLTAYFLSMSKPTASLNLADFEDSLMAVPSTPTYLSHHTPSWVYMRVLKVLFKFKSEIDGMFDRLVEELKGLLPDLGFCVAVDSKGGNSAGRQAEKLQRDGRRETGADWGKKTYRGEREDGTLWEKVVKWFVTRSIFWWTRAMRCP